ncbi:MAG: MFS transporter [Actinomycetales bacterium]|nr:MFS transporter [Actinomycetales bacterium]
MGLLVDLTPLRLHADFRRLWVGNALAGVGANLAATAISLQVYDLTGSPFSVGLVGLFGLIPLVALGLYGGAVVDTFDRRAVAIWGSLVMWLVALLNVLQAALGNTSEWVLYGLVALNSAAFGVVSPARQAIYPRILERELLPAANSLGSLAMGTSMLIGPMLAGLLVDWVGYVATYAADAVLFLFALWGLWRLAPVPPLGDGPRRVPGLRSVIDGFSYLAHRPNLRMSFFTDFCAMILAMPRALFPAVAAVALGGGARTVGLLSAAIAVGALVTSLLSGRFSTVVWQGRAVVVAVAGWGTSVAGFGGFVAAAAFGVLEPGTALVGAFVMLAFAGAWDTVSMVFRNTILQSAAEDHMRGRLQGVFIVVVAGGPRLGDVVAGSLGELTVEWAAVIGGVACVVAVLLLARFQSGFLRYDARNPAP